MDKELGPNGYVACCNAIVRFAIGDHGLSARVLDHPIGDIALVLILLIIPKFLSNVALRLG